MHTVTINDIHAQEDNPIEAENETDELGKEEQKSKFIHLRAKGNIYARIAEQIGVSKGTLVNWNNELDAEVAQARSVELEALQEEFFLLKGGSNPASRRAAQGHSDRDRQARPVQSQDGQAHGTPTSILRGTQG
jgi:hypothetical protein